MAKGMILAFFYFWPVDCISLNLLSHWAPSPDTYNNTVVGLTLLLRVHLSRLLINKNSCCKKLHEIVFAYLWLSHTRFVLVFISYAPKLTAGTMCSLKKNLLHNHIFFRCDIWCGNALLVWMSLEEVAGAKISDPQCAFPDASERSQRGGIHKLPRQCSLQVSIMPPVAVNCNI